MPLVVRSVCAVSIALVGIGCGDTTAPLTSAPPPAPPSIGKLTLEAAALDWGYVECGSKPAPKTNRVKNSGTKVFSYRIALDATPTSAFSLLQGATEGTLEPGATAEFTIGASIEGGEARVPFEGALAVASSDADVTEVRVPRKVIPDGARLMITPETASFGDVKVGQFATPIFVDVANAGFIPVQVTFVVPNADGFGLSWTNVPDKFVLGPTEKKTLSATFGPSEEGAKAFSSTMTVVGPACGDVPKALKLAGVGVVL
jgi:hypothetical protein